MSQVVSGIPGWEEQGPGKSLPGMRELGPGCVHEPTGELACSPLASPGGHHHWVCQLKGAVERGEGLGGWIARHLWSTHPVRWSATQSDNCDIRDSPEHTGLSGITSVPSGGVTSISHPQNKGSHPSSGEWLGSLIRSWMRREKRGCCQIMIQEDAEQAGGTHPEPQHTVGRAPPITAFSSYAFLFRITLQVFHSILLLP